MIGLWQKMLKSKVALQQQQKKIYHNLNYSQTLLTNLNIFLIDTK